MVYTAQDHLHRYSAWAAARASSVKNCRFSVAAAKEILEKANFKNFVASPENLPAIGELDREHNLWRQRVIEVAEDSGYSFTHGVAAKLINVYLKGALVCGGHHEHPKVQALHPPIDAVLLRELKNKNIGGLRNEWHSAAKIRWSKFDSAQYESVISNIRKAIPNKPLWEIEQYWRGHQ